MTTILWALIGSMVSIGLLVILIRKWEWMPLLLLPLVWYLPEQTSPGRLLEHFIFARWITVVLIPAIIFIQVMKTSRTFKSLQPSKMFPTVFMFVIYVILSAVINGTSIFDTIGYLLIYIRYPLLFIVLLNFEIKTDIIKKFVFLFLLLTFIQIPETMYRWLALDIRGDEISWSLGRWGTTNIGIYSLYTISIIIGYGLNFGFNFLHLVGIISLFLPAISGEIKAFIICSPPVALASFYYFTYKSRVKKYITIAGAMLIIGSMSVMFAQSWRTLHKTDSITTLMQNVEETIAGRASRKDQYGIYRMGILLKLVDEMKTDPKTLFFGYGPGSSLVGNFSGRPGLITRFLETMDTPNQIFSTLLDVGIVGLFLYLALLINIILLVSRRTKLISSVPILKVLHTAFPGICIFYLFIGPLYHTVWRFDAASFVFYFVAAILYQNTTKKGDDATLSVAYEGVAK